MRSLVWFRRDLRTRDHAALHYASRDADGGVVGVYVLCPQEWRNHDDAPVKIDFWLRNLRTLSADLLGLNIPLLVLEAPETPRIAPALLEIARRHGCDALYFNHEYEVNEQARDQAVARHFESQRFRVYAFHDHVVYEPGAIRSGEGRFYTIFTPFKNAFFKRVDDQGIGVLPPPKKQPIRPAEPSPIPPCIRGFESLIDPCLWPAGEQFAQSRLNLFCADSIAGYKANRDLPALERTSRLSPYLNAGVISPRQCLVAAREADGGRPNDGRPGGEGPAQWITEIIWREFYQHVLVGFPRVSMGLPFKPATGRIKWNDNPDHFRAWCEARTGVPIVDAAIRQLLATGWMHNRLRMIVAMYFTKDLFLDWRLGERFFMQHLIDGDLGSNNGGWQWSASTGTDAAPYFRIFNPITQSKRCDPDGVFIRRWLPELSEVKGDVIHDPSSIPALLRSGLDYPEPIVAREGVKERVVAAFKMVALGPSDC